MSYNDVDQFLTLLKEVDDNHEPKKYFKPRRKEIDEWFHRINAVVFRGQIYATFGHIEIRRRHSVWAEYSGWTDLRRNAEGKCKILQELPPYRNRPRILEKQVTICGRLSITNQFPSKRIFVEVLAHEMVHLYQFLYAQPAFSCRAVSHGKTFHEWKPTFKNHGLTLRVTLRHKEPKAKRKAIKK